ncbi:MAG: DUF2817 domain-containing protein [Planctomycetota bacterium]|nr:MAG: DUF2817 domain-containing protein [Planctomycetota bacterium]
MDDRTAVALSSPPPRTRVRIRAALSAAAVLLIVGCQSRVTGPTATVRRTPPPRRSVMSKPAPLPPPAPVRPAPRYRKVILGRSVHGAEIAMSEFGEGGPTLFVFGGIHGSEPTSAYLAQQLERKLRKNPDLYAGMRVAVLTAANPDGLRRGQRENARGVDLNRNFPAKNWTAAAAHGRRPASEPETQALLRAMHRLQPDAVIAIHAITGPRQCNNYDGPGRSLAQSMATGNGYPVRASIGYPTPGSFGSWAGVDRGIPVITLELPRSQSAQAAWKQNESALLAAIRSTARLARHAPRAAPVNAGVRAR